MKAVHRLIGATLCAISLIPVAGCGGGSGGGGAVPSTSTNTSATPTPKPSGSPTSSPTTGGSASPSPTSSPTTPPTATPPPTPTPVPTSTPATVMYVSDYSKNTIDVYSTGSSPTLLRTITTDVNMPVDITVDSQGTLYVLDDVGGRIAEFPAGSSTPSAYFYSGWPQPTAIAVGPDGRVFVSTNYSAAGVHVFNAGSQTVSSTVGTDILVNAGISALTVDSSNNLYAVSYTMSSASTNYPGTVYLIPNGTSATSTDLGLQQLKAPTALHFDSNGNLVVSSDGFGSIASTINYYTPGSTTPYQQITNGLNLPGHMAFDPTSGTLWVPCLISFSLGHGYLVAYPPGATSPSITITTGVTGPNAIAFGPAS